MEAVEAKPAAEQPESPVRGIDALLPALSRQAHEGAAVRIQQWYRHRQAECKASIFVLPALLCNCVACTHLIDYQSKV